MTARITRDVIVSQYLVVSVWSKYTVSFHPPSCAELLSTVILSSLSLSYSVKPFPSSDKMNRIFGSSSSKKPKPTLQDAISSVGSASHLYIEYNYLIQRHRQIFVCSLSK